MPVGNARFGATITNFTSATPGIIYIDNNFLLTPNQRIRVAGIADDQSGSTLNGDYTIDFVLSASVVLVEDTSLKANYISGGYLTVTLLDEPISPNPPYDAYNNVPDFWNQSNQI